MKKKFEQPKLNVISFSVKESITWDEDDETVNTPGFSDIITDW